MKYEAVGLVDGGRFRMLDRQAFETAFALFPNGPVYAAFESAPPLTRSPQQNRFWHAAIVQPLASYCSVMPNQMHEALKIHLLPERITIRRRDGVALVDVTIGQSTSKLTTREQTNLIDRAILLARRIPLDLMPLEDADIITHFIPFDAPQLGRHQQRALCGILTSSRQHATAPSCRECQALLRDEATP